MEIVSSNTSKVFVALLLITANSFIACQKKSQQELSSRNSVEKKEQISSMDTARVIAQADSLFQLADGFMLNSQKDSSLYYHLKVLEMRERLGKNDKNLLESNLKVGGFYRADSKNNVAEKYYEKAESIAQLVGIPVTEEIDLLMIRSNIKTNLKDIPTAISLLQKALDLMDKHHVKNDLILGRLYLNLGNAYVYDNQLERGIASYEQSVVCFARNKSYERLGLSFVAIGMAYSRLNENEKALASFQKALQYHLKWTGPETDPIAVVYLQKAFEHQAIGEIDSCRYYLYKNLMIRKKNFGDKDLNTFGAKFSLANFFEDTHEYDSALKYAHTSLISLLKDFHDTDVLVNPIPGPTEENSDLIIGLLSKASALENIAKRDSRDDYLHLALRTYVLADSIFAIYRRSLKFDDPQLRELETTAIPYDRMLEVAFRLFEKTRNSNYLDRSLQIIEHSRAVLLEAALNQAQEFDTVGGIRKYQDKEKLLNGMRSEIIRMLSSENLKKSTADSLQAALLDVNRSSDNLRVLIGKENPGYFDLRYSRKETDISEIQSLIKERNGIFIDYLWSDQKIYALIIKQDSILTKVVYQTDSFKSALRDFIRLLQASPDEAIKSETFRLFSEKAFFLYQKLLGDLFLSKSSVQPGVSLIFSANGPLFNFPFEALITDLPQGAEVNYQLPYLIQRFPVSYAYSAGVLLNQSKRDRKGNKLLALGFAGAGLNAATRDGLSNLPGTELEINSIKAVMKNDVNKYYFKADASESLFKNQAGNFDIVHLAIHGVADSTNALKSKLVFRSEADTIEDSNLYAHELYGLNFYKLDLAVLSACESGIGKDQSGEGVMSIARGFTYAGCPSQIISLWKINDQASARVMGKLYEHLSNGEAIDVSLANAKRDYLQQAKEFNSHPSYWAAFIAVGNMKSLDMSTSNAVWWWTALLVVLIALLIRRRYARNRAKV